MKNKCTYNLSLNHKPVLKYLSSVLKHCFEVLGSISISMFCYFILLLYYIIEADNILFTVLFFS